MSNAIIRMIATQDYEDITDLNTELGYDYDKEKVYQKIISILEAGNDILLVAEQNGKVIGYAHGSPYETLYADHLLNTVCFCVKEGIAEEELIGNELYDAFEERAKRFGYKGIRLSLDQEREKAHDLFLKHGFETKRSLNHYIKYFR
ncbi:MAG: GNAT family N-acetyltransferase [Erysipelotrichaceae bacterium]|nr:GNAT family N-acetyltransferase [Erysipelotrichaceae bacterium]